MQADQNICVVLGRSNEQKDINKESTYIILGNPNKSEQELMKRKHRVFLLQLHFKGSKINYSCKITRVELEI